MGIPAAPRGLIIDLITPLKRNGDIDERGLTRHLEGVLPYAQGLFVCSPHMGQGRELDPARRGDLLERTLAEVRGRIPVMAWVTQETTEGTEETLGEFRRRLRACRERGPVFWVDTPLYHHSNRGLSQLYRDISARIDDPFILHNDPALIGGLARPLKRNNIRTGILKELARISSIRGLIFLGSLDRARHYQKVIRTRGEFRFYDGDESQFLTFPSLSGVVSGTANLAPRAWQRITASSLNLRPQEKAYPDHLRQIWALGDYLRSLIDLCQGLSVPLTKKALADSGVIEDPGGASGGADLEEKGKALLELMDRFGGYPG